MRELRRHLTWYSAGTIFAAGTSIVLFLIYARVLPVEQLGTVVVVQATVTVLRIVGTGGAPVGMFRYLAGPPEDRAGRRVGELVTTALVFASLSSVLLGAIALLVASPIFVGLPGHDPTQLMALAALTATASAPREIVEFALRAHSRSMAWSLYTSGSAALLVACAALAVWWAGATAEAILVVQLGGLVVVAVAGMFLIRSELAPRLITYSQLRGLLRLGVPYSGTTLLDWIMRYVDRYILLAFVTATDLGVYGFGARIGNLVQQVGGAAAQAAWEPHSFQRHRDPGSAAALGRSATFLLVGVLALAVAAGAAAQPLVAAVGGQPEYLVGATFAFPLGVASWLGTVRVVLLTPLAIRFRPELMLWAIAAAAATTAILDLLLIPVYGIWGAAIAFVASYGVGALAALVLAQRTRIIEFEPKKLATALSTATIAYLIAAQINTPTAPITLVLRPTIALALYALPLVLFRVVPSPLRLVRPASVPA